MYSVMKSIHHMEHEFDVRAERFAFRHPYAAVLVMFIAVPIFILLSVITLTLLIVCPLTMLFM